MSLLFFKSSFVILFDLILRLGGGVVEGSLIPYSDRPPTCCEVKLDKFRLLALACWESSPSPLFLSEETFIGKRIWKFLRVVYFRIAPWVKIIKKNLWGHSTAVTRRNEYISISQCKTEFNTFWWFWTYIWRFGH